MKRNLFEDIPDDFPQEIVETLVCAPDIRVERIVSRGHASKPGFWYDQPEHEWVVVLKGQARLAFADGELLTLNVGDYVNIPAHRKHRVESTLPESATVWLAVFYRDEALNCT